MRTLPEGTVTFLLTDVEGSTRLWQQAPAPMRAALARHDALAADLIASHGGVLVKSRGEGDSLFAVFARATDAVAAACALQRALLVESWPEGAPLRVRMALHTGEADRRDGDYFGLAPSRGARLRAVAHGGQVLLTEVTAALAGDDLPEGAALRSLGRHRLQDLAAPEHVHQLLHPDLPSDLPPLRSLTSLPNNLPVQATPFIGRAQEMEEVRRLLGTARLLTLTGPGGTGKTRLALQAAADQVELFPDGAWLVELEHLTDGRLVTQTAMTALGLKEEAGRPALATLCDYLKQRRCLLLLDNCEHAVEAAASLAAQVLRSCSDVRLLATSRASLSVAGEVNWPVPPLAVPDPGRLPPAERLADYEAIRFFLDRAQAVRPAFTLTSENAPAIALICFRLEGNPLAMELAAARLRVLAPEQIAIRLDNQFRLLTGGSRSALPRQQTLRGLVDWSHNLLPKVEQVLWRRLSVFVGGFSLEAAEQICAGGIVESYDVLDLLASLADHSLIAAEVGGGEVRYRMLETIRQYGRERLREAGEEETVRRRHRDYFLAFAEEIAPRLRTGEATEAFPLLIRETDNLRQAVDWCEAEEASALLLRMVVALGWFWYAQQTREEGAARTRRALALQGRTDRTPERAAALKHLGNLTDDPEEQLASYEESLAIYRELGNRAMAAGVLHNIGNVLQRESRPDDALACFEEALTLARETRSAFTEALARMGLAEIWVRYRLQPERGREELEAALSLARREKMQPAVVGACLDLALVELLTGHPDRVAPLVAEAHELAAQMNLQRWILKGRALLIRAAFAGGREADVEQLLREQLEAVRGSNIPAERWSAWLESVPLLLLLRGDHEGAVLVTAAVQRLSEWERVDHASPLSRQMQEEQLRAPRAELGEERYMALWRQGRQLETKTAVTLAKARLGWA